MTALDEIFASAIRGYVAGELCGYSYHGDGSAIEALKRVDREADGIAAYARTHAGFADALVSAASHAAPTINTQEQLDAPELSGWGTLLMEVHAPDDGCADQNCWIVPVVWEMVNQVGWMCHNPRRDDETPHLPCRVLYQPNT